MILYALARLLSRTALAWFYRDIRAEDLERIPATGPVLIAANHPNSMVDAAVAITVVARRLTLTAKATLFANGVRAAVLARIGIVPLRRATDETREAAAPPDPGRNEEAFRAIVDVLAAGRAVLLFPEGRSHSEPALAPLRTGLARIAIQAREQRAVRDLVVVPLGINFEDKARPRSRVVVCVGQPVMVSRPEFGTGDPRTLTVAIEDGLRAVTLNFSSADDAAESRALSEVLAGLFDGVRPLGDPATPYADVLRLVRRIEAARRQLALVSPSLAVRAVSFATRLSGFRDLLAAHRVAPNDVGLDTAVVPGMRFAVRETAIVALAGPVAWWGRLNHWAPLRAAGRVARATSRNPDEPAMHWILAGTGLVLLAYALQTALVAVVGGPVWATAYLISLPVAALWNFRFSDRMGAARDRMRTYLLFRRDPALCSRLRGEAAWLRQEAAALEAAMLGGPAGAAVSSSQVS